MRKMTILELSNQLIQMNMRELMEVFILVGNELIRRLEAEREAEVQQQAAGT